MAEDLVEDAKMPEGTSMVDAADDILASALPNESVEVEKDPEDGKPAEPKEPTASPTSTDRQVAAQPKALGDGQPAPEPGNLDPSKAPPPDTLTGEIKEMWNKGMIDPKVKGEILKREGDFKKGMDQLRPQAELGDGYLKVIGPYLNVMKQYNVSPVQHTEDLLKYHAILMFGDQNQKAEIFLGLANDAGIDLRRLAQGQVAALPGDLETRKELARLQGTLSSVTSRFAAQDAKVMEEQIIQMAGNAEDFPHFWTVAPAMIEELKNNPRLSIEAAYRSALAANPTLFNTVVDSKAQKRAQAELAAARERAEKARKAKGVNLESTSNVRPASHKTKAGDLDLDAMLSDAVADINSRS